MKEVIEKMEFEISERLLNLNEIKLNETVIIVVDLINGFVSRGPFASDRVKTIIPNVKFLLEKTKECQKVFFRDIHTADSRELSIYPVHCVGGTGEENIVDELIPYAEKDNSNVIDKNSTNGFLTKEFQKWLNNNLQITNFIVIGCAADICVSDFAKTLQCYFCQNNAEKKIFIPKDCVETYDYGAHDGDIMKTFSLYSMHLAGIKIVDTII